MATADSKPTPPAISPQHAALLSDEAEKLIETLRYAAPELWHEILVDRLKGAYALGQVQP